MPGVDGQILPFFLGLNKQKFLEKFSFGAPFSVALRNKNMRFYNIRPAHA